MNGGTDAWLVPGACVEDGSAAGGVRDCSGGFEEQARVRIEKETTAWKKSRRQEEKNAANLCLFTDASLIRILCPEPPANKSDRKTWPQGQLATA